jgi:AraC family transcriptional regulator of adaptative response/methylated-DNA-[protein]-cysteine methyltransferase
MSLETPGKPVNAMDEELCWRAVAGRDGRKDGTFWYGVVTTGVYCRPSCPSRRPSRTNVRFYATTAEAERAGLRPCLRCRPAAAPGDDPMTRKVAELRRYLEERAGEKVTLAAMSRRVGASPFHLQRSFKARVGMTPGRYLEALRMDVLKKELRGAQSVSHAVYGAGFGSSSRVYERADGRLGMTPRQYRRGGEGVDVTHATMETPLGVLMLGATDRGLCFVQFGDAPGELLARLREEFPRAALSPMPAQRGGALDRWARALGRYLQGATRTARPPIDVRGTPFQMRVWRALQEIPHGELRSYSEVAAVLGQPGAARAVARACAANRLALVIPCHRVIRGDGGLGGYRWGLGRKRALIQREREAHAATR